MTFAVVQFKDINKSGLKKFAAVPVKWLYHFNIKDKISKSFTCFFHENMRKPAPTLIGEISDISDGKRNGHFYKVYVLKTFGK